MSGGSTQGLGFRVQVSGLRAGRRWWLELLSSYPAQEDSNYCQVEQDHAHGKKSAAGPWPKTPDEITRPVEPAWPDKCSQRCWTLMAAKARSSLS